MKCKPKSRSRRGQAVSHPRITLRAPPKRLLHALWLGALGLVFIGGIGYGARWLLDPVHLPVKNVLIEGEFTHLDTAALQHAAAAPARGGFFTVDAAAIVRAVQVLPWVERVSVRRIWPDTLRVAVGERVAVARWGDRALLTAHGESFAPQPDTWPAGLPVLSGPSGQEKRVLAEFHALGKALKPAGLVLAGLALDARRSWQAQLANGITLALGRERHHERLLRFVRLYPAALAARAEEITQVDLRYTNGFAVRWKAPVMATRLSGG
jgi:cell division protein FtsQ